MNIKKIDLGDTVLERVTLLGNIKWVERLADSDVLSQVKTNPERFVKSSKGRRTGNEFGLFELIKKEDTLTSVYHLKHPEYSNMMSVKFVVTEGLTIVTGDYGNWLFDREFRPQSGEGVSDNYWKEKLRRSSTQEPNEFNAEATEKEIEAWLHGTHELFDEDNPLTDQEISYLQECREYLSYSEIEFEFYVHQNNCGRFQDHESVPHVMKTQHWLEVVFDAFEEMCKRTN